MTTTEHWAAVLLIAIGIAITIPIGHVVRNALPHPTIAMKAVAATGAAAIASMLIPSGPLAAALAAPWWLVAVWFTAAAGRRFRRRVSELVRRPAVLIDELLAFGALIWWANAAAWLVAHRAGIEPLGFTRPITLLTVAHFHHAGFGLSVLLTSAHLRLGARASTRTMCVMHQVGMLLVAAGISLSDRLAVVGSVVITAALAGWAWSAIGPLRRQSRPAARRLLTVSAIAWVVPMGLAIGWAAGPLLAEPLVRTFETMLRFHGAINAIGLVLAGLVAIVISPPETAVDQLREDRDAHAHTTR